MIGYEPSFKQDNGSTMRQMIPWMMSCVYCVGLLAACGSDSNTGNAAPTSTSLKLQTVASNLSSPVLLTSPPEDQTRLFVVEQGGTIKVLDRATGSVLSTFLTLTGITSGGERGLLGLAFDPNYNANGRFYVNYTDANGAITIARFVVSAPNPNLADPNSRVILVSIPHPTFANHNGGVLTF
jgi:glucose/arabinose dehydrogenase